MHLLQTEHQPVEVLQLDRVLDMVRLQRENIITAEHKSSVKCLLHIVPSPVELCDPDGEVELRQVLDDARHKLNVDRGAIEVSLNKYSQFSLSLSLL